MNIPLLRSATIAPKRPSLISTVATAAAALVRPSLTLKFKLTKPKEFDGGLAAKRWMAENPHMVTLAADHILAILGRTYRMKGGSVYADKFKLPGRFISPDQKLSDWAGERWGNYDWLLDFWSGLAQNFSYHKQINAVYFHSMPPLISGDIRPDLSTCPLYD